jgi:hypothetical protein
VICIRLHQIRIASDCIRLHQIASDSHQIAQKTRFVQQKCSFELFSPCIRLHQIRIASDCIRLHQIASDSPNYPFRPTEMQFRALFPRIRLHQIASDCIRLHQIASDCIRLHQIPPKTNRNALLACFPQNPPASNRNQPADPFFFSPRLQGTVCNCSKLTPLNAPFVPQKRCFIFDFYPLIIE